MAGETPKVLLIMEDRARFGHISQLVEPQLRDSKSDLSVDTLVVSSADLNKAQEKIGGHLTHNKYNVILVPERMQVINAVKSKHLGIVLKYGVNPFHTLLDMALYDGYVDLSGALEGDHHVANAVKQHIE